LFLKTKTKKQFKPIVHVEANVFEFNKASAQVLEKNGFYLESRQ